MKSNDSSKNSQQRNDYKMSDYKELNEAELREYVKSHPQDEEAFQHYLAIVRKKPGVVVGSDDNERLIEELRKRI